MIFRTLKSYIKLLAFNDKQYKSSYTSSQYNKQIKVISKATMEINNYGYIH